MKNTSYILLLLLVLSCAQSPDEKLANINGYWEIAMIDDGAGNIKEFGMSQNIDFFEINADGTGIRKKVQPNVLGKFKATDASENIDVIIEEDILKLKYTTPFDTWTEKVYRVTQDKLVLVNEDYKIYTYRRYTPLIVE